jgi:hypothetical protein
LSTYRAKTGHDQTLVSLTTLDPQPDESHAGGIQHTRVTRAADGSIVKEGPYVELPFSELSASQYATLLTTFGLASADNANVTVYVRDVDMATWVRKNGIAQRPLPGDRARWNVRPISVTILVTDLENAA